MKYKEETENKREMKKRIKDAFVGNRKTDRQQLEAAPWAAYFCLPRFKKERLHFQSVST